MDSINSLQNEIGQYHNEKYLWEKEHSYNSIIFWNIALGRLILIWLILSLLLLFFELI